ncbi:hypothetical protein CEQ90_11745 [Lewinellaceae bacterium SD302]|nr:hypothetical protein CEQ90_11745 [Lewinellaceae bacterium SD302]
MLVDLLLAEQYNMSVMYQEAKLPLAKEDRSNCAHCGESCRDNALSNKAGEIFCCQGCRTVHDILSENGMLDFYGMDERAGQRQSEQHRDDYEWLEITSLADRYVQYRDERHCRVSLKLPAIHCLSCVWLLENLNRLLPGITSVRVNFARKEATILFDEQQSKLSEIARMLANIGYPPRFKENDSKVSSTDRPLIYRIGLAGFAFGNIMLLSLPEYFGLGVDGSAAFFEPFVGYLMLVLSLPVFFYAGDYYWRGAWQGLQQKELSLDVPITIGMAALFLRSAYEIFSQTGAGYLDSLAGLVFFLLLGRWFQSITYDRLSFDRDHKDYFPVAAQKLLANGDVRPLAVEEIQAGTKLLVRPGQLIPADGILFSGEALPIDYSFVTGEARAQFRSAGDQLYAGGRATKTALKIEVTRPAAESYLLQLWREKPDESKKDQLLPSRRLSRNFTVIVLVIALFTFVFWFNTDTGRAFQAATAVLIIACPCALALALPFAYGSMMRRMGKAGFFLRSAGVLTRLEKIDTYVFDKTGTLASVKTPERIRLLVEDNDKESLSVLLAMSLQSDHPRSIGIATALKKRGIEATEIPGVQEIPGAGLICQASGKSYRIGNAAFCQVTDHPGSATYGSCNGQLLVVLERDDTGPDASTTKMLESIQKEKLHLLSGDDPEGNESWRTHFKQDQLFFQQSPFDKEDYLEKLNAAGHQVLMTGDGLNDTGALRTASVGLAVTEDLSRFSPASDGIALSSKLHLLPDIVAAAGRLPLIMKLAYGMALLYNLIGLSFAVTGNLSPVVAAILMPISSISVVIFAVVATWFAARGFTK